VPIIALTVRDPAGKKFRAPPRDGPGDHPRPRGNPRPEQTEVEGVFVIRDGKAAFVPVQVGIAGDRYFEVVSGLEGGEIVVAGPIRRSATWRPARAVRTGDAAGPRGEATDEPPAPPSSRRAT
jgi:HlyD family secretion protein